MLDLALFLMGNPQPVSVSGSTHAEFGPKKRGIGTWGKLNCDGYYDVEDLATALIKMKVVSSLTLEVSWAANMDTSNQPYDHLMGADGEAAINGQVGKLSTEIYDRPADIPLTPSSNDEGKRIRLSQHFVECVREGKQPISDAMSGLTNNLILNAIYESSRTGKEVLLDWTI